MQIITTTTLNVSEENLALIPLVVESIGYQSWKEWEIAGAKKIAKTAWEAIEVEEGEEKEPFVFDEETVDTSVNTFIKYFLQKDAIQRLTNIITPSVEKYFGGVMKTQADSVKAELSEAITSVTTITE